MGLFWSSRRGTEQLARIRRQPKGSPKLSQKTEHNNFYVQYGLVSSAVHRRECYLAWPLEAGRQVRTGQQFALSVLVWEANLGLYRR